MPRRNRSKSKRPARMRKPIIVEIDEAADMLDAAADAHAEQEAIRRRLADRNRPKEEERE